MKKVNNIWCLALSFLIIASCASLDGSIKRGNEQYDNKAYASAIPHYKQALKKDSNNIEALTKIGDCYRLLNENKGAEKTYAKLSAISTDPINKYYYGKALMANGKYDQGKPIIEEYSQKVSSDIRGSKGLSGLKNLSKYFKDSSLFRINFLDFNTTDADLCPAIYKTDIVFPSSRPRASLVKNIHEWTDKPFYFLYKSAKNADGSYKKPSKFAKTLKTKYYDGPASFSNDYNEILLTRNNINNGVVTKGSNDEVRLKIFTGKVNAEGDYNESNLVSVPFNSNDYNVCHPSLSKDGTKMYFSSNMPDGEGGMDLYSVDRNGTSWGTPKNLGSKINTKGNEVFPTINQDGVLFFSSNGLDGLGELDIYFVNAANQNATPENIGAPLNSKFDDFGISFMDNIKSGYFTSNRKNGLLDDDIYSFTTSKVFKSNKMIKGIVKDKDGLLLANTKVDLYGPNGKVVETITTNEDASYSFDVEELGKYNLSGSKEKYFDGKNTANVLEESDVVVSNLILEKDPGFALRLLVTEGKTGLPLEGVKLKITDIKTGKEFLQALTPNNGEILKPLLDKKIGDPLAYKIELVKEGYFPKNVNFNHIITKPGIVNVDASLLAMDKEVKDLRDLVVINDIRFDLNKFNIRPDAALELDKVVTVMNKYPGMEVELGSHTDCRASIKYNETLSDKRAKASAAYIKSKISTPTRIYGKGYGESILLNGCACEGTVKSTCSEEEHQKNRRTEFKIISMGSGTEKLDVINNSTDSFKKGK